MKGYTYKKLDIAMRWYSTHEVDMGTVTWVSDLESMELAEEMAGYTVKDLHPVMGSAEPTHTGNEILDKEASRIHWDYFIRCDYQSVRKLLTMSEVQIMMVLCMMYFENIVNLGVKPDHLKKYVDAISKHEYEWYQNEEVFMNFWHASNETPEHLIPFIDVNAAMDQYGLFRTFPDNSESFIIRPEGPMDVRKIK